MPSERDYVMAELDAAKRKAGITGQRTKDIHLPSPDEQQKHQAAMRQGGRNLMDILMGRFAEKIPAVPKR